ncbi:MAG: DNA repair protein RecO (recombination protein O) [Halioglobus sp.]
MRVQLQPAFVLHSRNYRDSSHLLEVLTAEYGRLALVSKGSRRAVRGRSKGAILQPFIPLLISFTGRNELMTLTGSEVAGPAATLAGERLFSGIYLNELVVRLLHRNDAHTGLFIAYGDAVASLGGDEPLDEVLRRFEFNLLDELGYSFDLRVDGHSGEPIEENYWYHYHQEFGLVRQRSSSSPDNRVYAGQDLLGIAAGERSEAVRLTSKRLLREALAGHLGEKPLMSRDLFRRSSKPTLTSREKS